MTYNEFLKTKELQSVQAGFDVDRNELNPKGFEFQKDIVQWALRKGKAAIFSDCGSGKTEMSLDFAYQVHKKTGYKALIIAPLAVVRQTQKEGVKFGVDVNVCREQEDVIDGINITNYEIIDHFDASSFGCVILDECFAPDTLVEVVEEDGKISEKPISKISSGDKVKNCLGISKVKAVKRKKVSYAIRIKINGRYVLCSPRHPFFTQRGWVCAKDLQENDVCITTDKAMRILRKDFSNRLGFGVGEEVLQQILFCEMENEPTGDNSESAYKRNTQEDRSKSIKLASEYGERSKTNRENPQLESNVESENKGESICQIEGDEPCTFKAWGQWSRDDIATAVNDGCIARRLDSGMCYLTGQETARIPNELQSRLRELRNENCDRDRWELTLCKEGAGQEKGRKADFFRVESFEVLEQRCAELDKYRDADGQLYFYDLEIEQHPSFTVNGCLVHNSSILKSFTSATRNELIDRFIATPYKLCCTATPSPNDHSELANHAEFLGIMTRTEMLATYFIHDGSDTSKWRLKGYGEKRFWEWVATWAVCVRNPADLGYSNEGYDLPELNLIEHIVESETKDYELVPKLAETLSERREARKESIDSRVEVARQLVEENDDTWLIWCDYNAESSALHKAIKDSVEIVGADSPDRKAQVALDFADGKIKALVSKCSIYGFGMNFQTTYQMIFCGISDSFESFYQAIRRCWRYGQEHDVNVHIIISQKEKNVLDNIKRKQRQMEEMQSNMIALMKDVTMSEMKHTTRITTEYKPKEEMEIPTWIA